LVNDEVEDGGADLGVEVMKVMIRRSPEVGLSIYVPKKDLEEPIVDQEHETLWAAGFALQTAGCSICLRWRRVRRCLSRSMRANAVTRSDPMNAPVLPPIF